MEIAILVAAVLIAGLACPAVMWWQRRRGREAPCCPSAVSREDRTAELQELRRSQAKLSTRLDRARERAGTGHS